MTRARRNKEKDIHISLDRLIRGGHDVTTVENAVLVDAAKIKDSLVAGEPVKHFTINVDGISNPFNYGIIRLNDDRVIIGTIFEEIPK